MSLTIGIDDAGRGPVLGGMYLAGVLLEKTSEEFLKKHNVTDSKVLTQEVRVRLSKIIEESSSGFKVLRASPEEIDSAVSSGLNLNTLEAIKCAEIIDALNPGREKIRVIVDCPSVNTQSWSSDLKSYIKNLTNLEISCEHKADANHISVSAASILAKVAREEEVSKLKKAHGPIGSGYPSDPQTKEYLRDSGEKIADSGIVRKTWSTWRNLYPEDSPEIQKVKAGKDKKQKTLF
jgi:ribonuclease HII